MPTEMNEQPPNSETEQRPSGSGSDTSQQAYERFADGQAALEQEIGEGVEPPRPSRKSAWLAMGAVAVALGLLWLAPGSGVDTTQQSADPTGSASGSAADGGATIDPDTAADALAVGKPAPLQFTMKDMNGVDVKLASFKGKVILLNFWATWCGPCQEEIPSLVDLQQQYGEQLVILGVSIDDPLSKLKPYATKMHMNYPVLVGKDRQDVQDAFGPLFGIPVSVFVDRDGRIWKRHSGIASREQFEREIKALL
jgi:thiol-disulfide isomerase/thioredoxin